MMLEFLEMGGYAFYVWTAYGVAAVVLLWNLVHALIRYRRLRQQIERDYCP